jgi:hypothetical protein
MTENGVPPPSIRRLRGHSFEQKYKLVRERFQTISLKMAYSARALKVGIHLVGLCLAEIDRRSTIPHTRNDEQSGSYGDDSRQSREGKEPG